MQREYVVAAPGPSLPSLLHLCTGNVIAVNNAYQLLPDAPYMYACDAAWWDTYRPVFAGERWSSHNDSPRINDNKTEAAKRHGLKLIRGQNGDGFCLDGGIHYGQNSGFQAVNLAIAFGAKSISLVGFDMHGGHFFGDHPDNLGSPEFVLFIREFEKAARLLPKGIEIVNRTPGSALTCFPYA